MFGGASVLVGESWPNAEAGLLGGATILAGTPGLPIWRLGDCVCDRLGGTFSCFVGSMFRGGDNIPAPGAKEAVYGREDELAC